MIHLRNDVRRSGIDARRLRRTTRKLLQAAGEGGSHLSLSLVDDDQMREINRKHRGIDRPTDVLSFPLQDDRVSTPASPERHIGDVVISLETAKRQAAEYDAPVENELYRLLIHGLLHVLGHDHEAPPERAAMEREERRLAAAIGMPWPYD